MKHVATLTLTEEPDSDEIAMLLDDTIERSGTFHAESNEDGSYDLYLDE